MSQNPESAQEGTQQPQEITHIGDLEIGAVNAALAQHYGEEVTFNELDGLRSLKTEHDQLKSKYDQMKLELGQNRYADPLIERLDEMARKGSSRPELIRYMGLQNLDVDQMSAEEAIKTWKSLERPGYTGQDINDWFNTQYPPLADDASDFDKRSREIKLKEDAFGAKDYISKQKVASENPEAVQQREAQARKREEATKGYNTQAASLMKEVVQIPYEVKEQNFDFTFDYAVPKDEKVDAEIQNAVVEQALASGITFDEEGRGKMRDMIAKAYKTVYHDQIIRAVINDAWASITKQSVVNNGNPAPVNTGSGNAGGKPPATRQLVKDQGGRKFV